MVIGFAIGRIGIVNCVVSIRVCLCRRHTSAQQEPGSPERLPSQNEGKKGMRKGKDNINAMPEQNGGRARIALSKTDKFKFGWHRLPVAYMKTVKYGPRTRRLRNTRSQCVNSLVDGVALKMFAMKFGKDEENNKASLPFFLKRDCRDRHLDKTIGHSILE